MPLSLPDRQIKQDFLIVGEGKGDAAFFEHLCSSRGIDGFQIVDAGGNGNWEIFLKGLGAWTHIERLKGLIIAADCDDNPQDQFKKVRKALKSAELPYPEAAMQVAKRSGAFSVVVLMIPFSETAGPQKGCLESLLLQSARDHHATMYACVTPFATCVGADNWAKTPQDKLRMRALLAAAFPSDPNYSLQYALSPAKNLIPLQHACFNCVDTFLRDIQGKM